MTIEQKMEIVRMRLEGMSYVEIGKRSGYSWKYICRFFKQLSSMRMERGRKLDAEKWARPRIAEWLSENGITVRAFAEHLGIKPCTIHAWFRAGGEIPYYRRGVLNAISAETNIPEHELVRKRGDVIEGGET